MIPRALVKRIGPPWSCSGRAEAGDATAEGFPRRTGGQRGPSRARRRRRVSRDTRSPPFPDPPWAPGDLKNLEFRCNDRSIQAL